MSVRSNIIAFAFKIIPFRHTVIKKYLSLSSRKKKYLRSSAYPFWFKKKWNITTNEINGHQVFQVEQKENTKPEHVIFFLHGGGYIFKATKHHWWFLNRFLRRLSCAVVLPDYPISPDYTQEEMMNMVLKSYHQTAAKYGSEKIIIMGDSAGGGLSLLLVQQLKKEKANQPKKVIMLSPWLDVSMNNPEIKKMAHLDPFLKVDLAKMAANAFCSGKSAESEQYSPIYGDIKDLPELSIFIGTHDIFYPDCKKFKDLCLQKNIPLNYYEYPKMIHVWMLFHLPESKDAMKDIFSIIE